MLPKAIVLIILAFVIAIFGVIACESYRLIAAVVTELYQFRLHRNDIEDTAVPFPYN